MYSLQIFDGKSERNKTLGTPKVSQEDEIKMDLQNID
jgi:hypothetical protein